MRIRIPTRLIGSITATAVAVTTLTAVPAYADRDNSAAGAVAAILGLAVVGAIINDHADDKKHKHVSRPAPVRRPHAHVYRHAPKARDHGKYRKVQRRNEQARR